MNIALISPNKNAYSETFIRNHKKKISGNITYYYGGYIPNSNEVEGELRMSIFEILLYKFGRKIKNNKLSRRELTLLKSLKKNKISVVVAEYGVTGVKILKICKELNLPLITIFHGYDASVKELINTHINRYQELFKYAHKIVVVSNTIKENLIAMQCPENKIIVSPCGPDSSFYNMNPTFQNNQLIACGRFVDKKAPYYTILAFNKVLKELPNAKLIMGGDGVLFNMCKNLINHLEISQNVELLGKITPEELKDLMKNSTAFVQHSIQALSGDSEGTPVAVLEASLLGLPVISTKHSGIKDVVKHKETGYLVDEHDVDNMAKYMIKILKNKELARKMGENGKRFIVNTFSEQHHIKILNTIIKESIEC